MNPEEILMVETWGRRLSREAQRLIAKWMPELPLLRQSGPLLNRLTSLPTPAEDRFKRVESIGPRRVERLVGVPRFEEEGLPLPGTVKVGLIKNNEPRLEQVRVHINSKADAITRKFNADALTIGKDIYFRQGRFRPGDQAGLALLAHELEHILAALQPNAAWRRATTAGLQDEEEQALASEHQILNQAELTASRPQSLIAASSDVTVRSLMTHPITPSMALTTPLQRPMAAKVGRDLDSRPSTPEGSSTNLEVLRRELYRDLLSQIRADLERGA